MNKGHSLAEFTDPKNFKSYDELAKKLIEVLGPTTGTGIETVQGYEETTTQVPQAAAKPTEKSIEDMIKDTGSTDTSSDDEEDDALAKLKAMMDGE